MLETFRKRDNPREPARPAAPAFAPPQRTSAFAPQARVAPLTPDARTAADQAPPVVDVAEPESAAASAPPPVPSMPSTNKASGGAARLIVGPDIKLKGAEITDCDTLIVEGQVEACMHSRVIEVDEQGFFRGNVQVDIADIRGRFEGELTALKQLMVRASGRITGKIRYGKIQIDEGGELAGDVASARAVGSDVPVRVAVTASGVRAEHKVAEPQSREQVSAAAGAQPPVSTAPLQR